MTVQENVRIGLHTKINYGVFSSFLRTPAYFKEEKEAEKKVCELLSLYSIF